MFIATKQATITEAGKGRKLNVLGHVVNVMLGADTGSDSFAFEAITPPGGVVPVHLHEYEDEYGYVAEGVFEFYLDGRTVEAPAGAVVHCPRHTSHGFRNIGATAGKTIWLSTPGTSVERFFDELGALPADAPPDMQKVGAIFAKYSIQVLPTPGM
jgi:quercetin dioxygenase-like cupin family protein